MSDQCIHSHQAQSPWEPRSKGRRSPPATWSSSSSFPQQRLSAWESQAGRIRRRISANVTFSVKSRRCASKAIFSSHPGTFHCHHLPTFLSLSFLFSPSTSSCSYILFLSSSTFGFLNRDSQDFIKISVLSFLLPTTNPFTTLPSSTWWHFHPKQGGTCLPNQTIGRERLEPNIQKGHQLIIY